MTSSPSPAPRASPTSRKTSPPRTYTSTPPTSPRSPRPQPACRRTLRPGRDADRRNLTDATQPDRHHHRARPSSAATLGRLLEWIVGQRLSYSVGFTLPNTIVHELAKVSRAIVAAGLRCRGRAPRGRVGARGERAAGPIPVAQGHASDRPQGTPAPRCAAAPVRRRRTPADRVRHQHPAERATPPTRRPGTTPPPPGPRRGSHPRREGHRPEPTCPCTSWIRTGSGAPSSPWPANSPTGPELSRPATRRAYCACWRPAVCPERLQHGAWPLPQ
jgi:hypothetical protein